MLKFKSLQFLYKDGEHDFMAITSSSLRNDRMVLEINTQDNVFSVTVKTNETITIQKMYAEFEYFYSDDEKIFLNGYQSWTDSVEHNIGDKMRGISHIPCAIREKYAFSQYGDYNFADYGEYMHGWTYGYIRNGDNYSFMGSLCEESGFTQIITQTDKNIIAFRKDCSGVDINGEWCALKLYIEEGAEKEVFDVYFDLLGVAPRKCAKPVFGYTSWYNHYQDINEKTILDDLSSLDSLTAKADVFQIDDGWQTAVGDWLSVDSEKFPDGMKKAADDIKKAGMTAGIWLAPFVCEENSEIFRNNKSWLLVDEKGDYVKGGSNWSGFYALDIYNYEVRAYIKNVLSTVINDWGYGLLKLDFLYAACLIHRKDKTRGQVMAEAMDFLRKCAGDALILGCGVPLASAFGIVDYCRIGCDVSLDWNDKPHMRLMHRERVSTKKSILNSVFRRQLDKRAFLSDPDVFLLRPCNISMSEEKRKCLAEINALMGSVLFTSDNFFDYGEAELKELSKIMKIRDAEIIAADLNDGELTLRFRIGDRKYIKTYSI
ncbi:glycoside hydrolase family 36 protein [Ruminococcus flavefaciens]|uniref:Alpha-galactosidase n=1 Tax=Ruminococcus flavefaciens TaxID=1265 RepID=A0A1M7I047_RUMFL|nr:glycoside hydrolase family 36 protein [Ruminococcus flavefaciens]SHM33943.1 alpha-galactosidase [Ruminococcus flavefaciens]